MLIACFRAFLVFAAIACATLGVALAPATAQEVPSKVHVVVGGDNGESTCNLSKEGLEGAAKAALRYNRVEVIQPENGVLFWPVIGVIADTDRMSWGCQTILQVSLIQRDAYPDGNGGFYNGHFVFCEAGSTLSGDDLSSRVYAAVRESVDTCLGGITKTDQPDLLRRLLEKAAQ